MNTPPSPKCAYVYHDPPGFVCHAPDSAHPIGMLGENRHSFVLEESAA